MAPDLTHWRRTSPVGAIGMLARHVPGIFVAGGAATFFRWINDEERSFGTFGFTVLIMACVFGIPALLSYWKFRFRVKDGRIQLRRGVFNKSSTELPFDRIQAINIESKLLDRVFRLETLKFDSAGTMFAEVVIPSLTKKVAAEIRAAVLLPEKASEAADIKTEKREALQSEDTPEPPTVDKDIEETEILREPAAVDQGQEAGSVGGEETIVRLGLGEIVRIGFTSRRWMILGGLLSILPLQTLVFEPLWDSFRTGGTREVVDGLQDDFLSGLDWTFAWFGELGIWATLMMALGSVVVLPGILIASAVFSYHDFTLRRKGATMTSRRGLFTKVVVSVSESRIQHVRLHQNPLMKVLHRYELKAPSAEGSTLGNAEVHSAETLSVPLLKGDRADKLARRLLGGVGIDLPFLPDAAGLTRVSPLYIRALFLRSLRRPVLFTLVGILVYLNPDLTTPVLIGFPAWLLLQIPVSWMKWKNEGYALTDRALVARRGLIGKESRAFLFRKGQKVSVRRSPLELRKGLATLQVVLASGSEVVVPFIDHSLACDLRDRILYSAETDPSRWF